MSQYPSIINLSDLNGSNGFSLTGSGMEFAGHQVASAGDVNGDGYDDVIVSAEDSSPHGSGSGASYVVFGKASGFAANTSLASLNGATGFKISGLAAGDYAGTSVASAGDVNGDGFSDLIIGAEGADPHGDKSGAAYVVFGKASGFSANLDLSTLNGVNGFKISGAVTDDYAGWSVASAGDVNGDGFGDLIIGAIGADPHGATAGASYVVFGKAAGFGANLDLSTLNGANGFELLGPGANDQVGRSVASAGDLNGDGFDDLIVGSPYDSPHGSASGAAFVVFGKASGFGATLDLFSLNGSNGFKISGAASGDYAGWSVASAGDVNGDGYADLIIGAEKADPNADGAGASYVVFGKASGFAANIDVSTLNGTTGFKISGNGQFDYSGVSVASAGDVNGDGFDDLIVGASGANPHGNDSGSSYVVFGKASGFAANLDVSSLNGANGFRIDGTHDLDSSGGSVASAGDVNGDGLADLIIGAQTAAYGAGVSFVVLGRLPDASVSRTGTAASQNLVGSDSGDTLNGLGGDDHLYGHGGNDSLYGGAGNDIIDGGPGIDIAYYTGAVSAVTISLAVSGPQNTGGDGIDTLISIEGIEGSALADQLTAASAGSQLYGFNGNDLLIGAAGNDFLSGGTGVDAVSYAGATAGVHVSLLTNAAQNTGGAGTDTLYSIEKLIGSDFADTLTANSTGATLNGGPGGDDLIGGPGSDILNGGGAADFADYSLATAGVTVNLTLAGFQNTVGAGSDELVAIEKLVGSNFNDTLTGDAGVNTLYGQGGDDTINGGDAGDYIFGGLGNDTLNGQGGQDSLTGQGGNDSFVFSALADTPAAHPDTITDFTSGQDHLDLHLIDADTGTAGDQAFHVGGGGGHAGDIVVHAFDAGNNRTQVDLYVDNNASVDAAIWLTGDHHALAAGDFVL